MTMDGLGLAVTAGLISLPIDTLGHGAAMFQRVPEASLTFANATLAGAGLVLITVALMASSVVGCLRILWPATTPA